MMPPEKMAEIGETMSAAIAAAVKADPNNNVSVHRVLWDMQLARIADLEAVLRFVAAELDTPLEPVTRVQLRAYVVGELKRLRG